MKAIVISGPGRADVTDVTPPALGPEDVLVKILATGCCGTDVELFEGTMPYLTSGLGKYPLIPGHEWVGEVYELGENVTGFVVGDRVVGECSCGCMRCERCRNGQYHRCAYRTETGVLNRAGAFAEFIHFPSTFLHRISKEVPIESACLIEPAAVAFNGARKAEVSPSDNVAIFGDGPIGLLLVMMSKAFGARTVTLVGGNADRLALGSRFGADAVVDIREETPSSRFGHGSQEAPSVIIEATGNPASIIEAVNSAAPGGRIVLQGIFAGQKLNGLDLDRVVVGEVRIQGALGSPGIWKDVIGLVETGRVNPSLLVTEALRLEQYREAIELVTGRRGVKTIVREM